MAASGAPSIALIGAGRMGAALATGWLSGRGKRDIRIVDPKPSETVQAWADAGKVTVNPDPAPVDVLIVAVKPQVFPKMAESLKPWIGPRTVVVSIMAGTRLKQLSDRLGTGCVVRAMPNTPGAIGKGVTVICKSDNVTDAQVSATQKLLEPLGEVIGPVDEKYMSVVTGLSGSGPAYVFLLAEAMADAAMAEGLPEELASRLAQLTVEGAAALMGQSGEAPNALRKAVTSPGGTTQAALDILMDEGGITGLMRKAIRAAANRDRELSRDTD